MLIAVTGRPLDATVSLRLNAHLGLWTSDFLLQNAALGAVKSQRNAEPTQLAIDDTKHKGAGNGCLDGGSRFIRITCLKTSIKRS